MTIGNTPHPAAATPKKAKRIKTTQHFPSMEAPVAMTPSAPFLSFQMLVCGQLV
jgi:hypothetical protein